MTEEKNEKSIGEKTLITVAILLFLYVSSYVVLRLSWIRTTSPLPNYGQPAHYLVNFPDYDSKRKAAYYIYYPLLHLETGFRDIEITFWDW
ncbi:hypothetical protein ACFL4W_02390 [Planctomycetota bacterium]